MCVRIYIRWDARCVSIVANERGNYVSAGAVLALQVQDLDERFCAWKHRDICSFNLGHWSKIEVFYNFKTLTLLLFGQCGSRKYYPTEYGCCFADFAY